MMVRQSNPPKEDPTRVRLGKSRIDSILNECAAMCAAPEFFATCSTGINCASGFIRFDPEGRPHIEPHSPDHRCRHTLPGKWSPEATGTPPENSLLRRFLDGLFRGDVDAEEKNAILAEICGSVALGYATKITQPRAVILFGQTAENGKSQFLDVARGLLPSSGIGSVPASRMGDERHIVGLIGKLLNAADELSAGAIASDAFKAVVTGEPVEGRDVYKSRIEFRSVAQKIFATNVLPPFRGGFDRGVQRRLLVIPFNRSIPIEERVEQIGRRIAEEEPDLLLGWAIAGAGRLIRQRNFNIPISCKESLSEWIFGADPVLAWLHGCTKVRPVVNGDPRIRTRAAFEAFQTWATAEGFKRESLPNASTFVQRVIANWADVKYKRVSAGGVFLGLTITHWSHAE